MLDSNNPEAAAVHRDNLVWNALDATTIKCADDVFAKTLNRAQLSGCIHTVLLWEGVGAGITNLIRWRRFYEQSPHLRLGLKAEDAVLAKAAGQTAMFMGTQDITALDGQIDVIDALYHSGLRVLQPTYQRRSLAGDGCGERVQSGLSMFGVDLVRRCNELGILLDISHVSDATTFDMFDVSQAPMMATHATVRAISGNIRAKSDEIIKELVNRGGMIGIAAKSGFLKKDGTKTGSTMDDYIDHIAYVCDLVGTDHVGIGTDINDPRSSTPEMLRSVHKNFPELTLVDPDGDFSLIHPEGLKTADDIPNITAALLRRGFGVDDVKKIIGGNVQRVMQSVIG